MKRLAILRTAVCAIVGFLLTAGVAFAVPFGFESITANGVDSPGIGEAQLFVDVTETEDGQVLFTFINMGPEASSITDVYFDDGSLLGIASLIDADENGGDTGVNFSQGATPGNLPSGNTASPPFVATAGFTADSDSPAQPNGVNPGESLGIVFTLQDGQTFDDVINELNDGTLRIGIHVQGFDNGASESFINIPHSVPEPGSLLLTSLGLFTLAGYGWRRKKMPVS